MHTSPQMLKALRVKVKKIDARSSIQLLIDVEGWRVYRSFYISSDSLTGEVVREIFYKMQKLGICSLQSNLSRVT